MREIELRLIEDMVRELFIKANKQLPNDLADCIRKAANDETEELPKSVMVDIAANLGSASRLDIPICQDTGMAVVFFEIGQDVHFAGGSFENAVNKGVARAYTEGYLRCSVVGDPLRRQNTNDNTPAIIHTRIVDGDHVRITAAPKGFGSENMSALKMLTPSAAREDIIGFIISTVKAAGSNACPPMVIGVGIGGDFEYCAYLAKKALCRPVSSVNPDSFYAALEDELLTRINSLDIGPQGFGGKTTALSVAVEAAPTHIAGLPVSVNIGCHVTRHAEAVI